MLLFKEKNVARFDFFSVINEMYLSIYSFMALTFCFNEQMLSLMKCISNYYFYLEPFSPKIKSSKFLITNSNQITKLWFFFFFFAIIVYIICYSYFRIMQVNCKFQKFAVRFFLIIIINSFFFHYPYLYNSYQVNI